MVRKKQNTHTKKRGGWVGVGGGGGMVNYVQCSFLTTKQVNYLLVFFLFFSTLGPKINTSSLDEVPNLFCT